MRIKTQLKNNMETIKLTWTEYGLMKRRPFKVYELETAYLGDGKLGRWKGRDWAIVTINEMRRKMPMALFDKDNKNTFV